MSKLNQIYNRLSRLPYMTIVGSKSRGSTMTNDLDYITSRNLKDIILTVHDKLLPIIKKFRILVNGSKHIRLLADNIQIDVWRYKTPQERIFMYFSRTGTKQFNIRARRLAKLKGYKLTDTGLYKDGHKIHVNNERDLFKKLGMTYKTVKERVK